MRRDLTHSDAEVKRAEETADAIFERLNRVLDEAKDAVADLERVYTDGEAERGG